MPPRNTIVGIGETLFDVVGSRSALGGAPLNFCVMVNQLLEPKGFTTAVVSSVGADDHGTIARRHLDDAAINTTHLQTHPTLATGVARVYESTEADTECSFEILSNVAWDDLHWTPALHDFTNQVGCVVYGTLAQRSQRSRNTINRFLSSCPQAIRLFDVNLRMPHYDDESIRSGCRAATILKLNTLELSIVTASANIAQRPDPIETCVALLKHFSLNAVVLTASEKGTTLITADQAYAGNVPQITIGSSVGAGDACTAGIVAGLTLDLGPLKIVDLANQLGGLVASNNAPNLAIPRELIKAYIPCG